MVIFLYRDDYYNDDTENGTSLKWLPSTMALPMVELAWIPEFTKFGNHLYDEQPTVKTMNIKSFIEQIKTT